MVQVRTSVHARFYSRYCSRTPSTRYPARLDADIGIVACIPLRVLTKLLFAVTRAEEILSLSVICPELCRILIDHCKTSGSVAMFKTLLPDERYLLCRW